jgi:hypothetical protein
MGVSDQPKRTFWGTLGHLARQPWTFRIGLLAIVVGGAVLAIVVGNRYGDFWGGVIGIMVTPLIATRFIRQSASR